MSPKCVLLLLCYHLLLGGAVSEFTPTVYSIKSSAECGQYNPLHDQELKEKLTETVVRLPHTCVDILDDNPSASSGYYNIITTNGSTVQVYCDLEGTNCGGEGGWTRVAYVNMTQPGATCPQGLWQRNFDNLTLCARDNHNHTQGCDGTAFSGLTQYSKVCGRVRGYQQGAPISFFWYSQKFTHLTIDDAYVDGISITYGNTPRKHIWTYAGGSFEKITTTADFVYCPCSPYYPSISPPYVGTDYYCESGIYSCCLQSNTVADADPLWDGQQCGGSDAPCCTRPNMPWFIKTLNETTIEDIELRLCRATSAGHGETPLDLIDIFVK